LLLNPPTPTSCLPPANLDQQAALVAGLHDRALLSDAPPLSVDIDPVNQPQQSPTIRRNVYTTSMTTLSVLYTYEDVNAWVEYPETSPDHPVGYLFRRDPHNWENPVRNFAYSLGKQSGQTEKGQERKHLLLVDRQGSKVPCVVSHLTCMGFRSWVLYYTEICQVKARRFALCRTSS
jgi:hypothetical protein